MEGETGQLIWLQCALFLGINSTDRSICGLDLLMYSYQIEYDKVMGCQFRDEMIKDCDCLVHTLSGSSWLRHSDKSSFRVMSCPLRGPQGRKWRVANSS